MLNTYGYIDLVKSYLNKNINILSQEVYVTVNNFYHFSKGKDSHNSKNHDRATLSTSFSKLQKLVDILLNRIYSLHLMEKETIELINKLKNNNFPNLDSSQNKIKDNDTNGIIVDILQGFLNIKRSLSKNAELLHFLQKKMSYLLDSYPVYYPTLSFYRTKQEVKNYEWLKKISSEFLNKTLKEIFKINKYNIDESNIVINWSANDENTFLPEGYENELIAKNFENENPLILFDGSYFLINRPTLWIILFHECLHYTLHFLYSNKSSHNKEDQANFLEWYYKLKNNALQTLEQGHTTKFLKGDLLKAENLFDEIFCDSILTYLYDTKYFYPLFGELLCSPIDNNYKSVLEAIENHNWIRLYVSAHFLNDEKSKTNALKFLNKYQKSLEYKGNWHLFDFLESDERVANVLINYADYLVKTLITKKALKGDLFLDNWGKVYLNVIEKVVDKINNEDFQIKEGRMISSSLNLLDFPDYYIQEKEIEEHFINSVEKYPLVKIVYIKTRFDNDDGTEDFLSENGFINKLEGKYKKLFEEPNLYFSFSPYTFISFETMENEHEGTKRIKGNNESNCIRETLKETPYFFKQVIVGHEIFSKKDYSQICNSDLVIISQFTFKKSLLDNYKKYDSTKDAAKYYEQLLKNRYFKAFDFDIDNYHVIQTSTWADFIIILDFNFDKNKPNKISDIICDYKKAIHNNKFISRSTSDFAFKHHNNAPNSLKFSIEKPLIYLKVAVKDNKEKTTIENEIKRCISSSNNTKQYNINHGVGIYDYMLTPTIEEKHILVADLFYNLIAKLFETKLFTDIQLRYLASVKD